MYQIKLILDTAVLSSVVDKWHTVCTEKINLMIYHPLYFKKKDISVVSLIIIIGPENTNITWVLIRITTNRKTSCLQNLLNLFLCDTFYTYHSFCDF